MSLFYYLLRKRMRCSQNPSKRLLFTPVKFSLHISFHYILKYRSNINFLLNFFLQELDIDRKNSAYLGWDSALPGVCTQHTFHRFLPSKHKMTANLHAQYIQPSLCVLYFLKHNCLGQKFCSRLLNS